MMKTDEPWIFPDGTNLDKMQLRLCIQTPPKEIPKFKKENGEVDSVGYCALCNFCLSVPQALQHNGEKQQQIA